MEDLMKIRFKSLLLAIAFLQISFPANAQVNNDYEITYVCSVRLDDTNFLKMNRDGSYSVDSTYNNYLQTQISIFKNNYKIVGSVPTFSNEVGSWVKMPISGKVSLGAWKSKDGTEDFYDMTMGGLTGEWSSWGRFSVSLSSFTPAKLSCNEPSD
jgi:hypothetical protein